MLCTTPLLQACGGPDAAAQDQLGGCAQPDAMCLLSRQSRLTLPFTRPSTPPLPLPPLQGWLPFCFTFLGFSPALKLLLFITLFSVFSAAILYRLYLHSDKQGKMSLAGERRMGGSVLTATVSLLFECMPCRPKSNGSIWPLLITPSCCCLLPASRLVPGRCQPNLACFPPRLLCRYWRGGVRAAPGAAPRAVLHPLHHRLPAIHHARGRHALPAGELGWAM